MGLFDFLKKPAETKPSPAAAPSPGPTKPFIPDELRAFRQKECIKVANAIYFQDSITALGEGETKLTIRKAKDPNRLEYIVSTTDGTAVGYLSAGEFERSGLKSRGTVRAIVAAPHYELEEFWTIYLPRTEEAIAAEAELEELQRWIQITDSHWYGPEDEYIDLYNCEWVLSADEKPTIALLADGVKVFDVTPRMKSYSDVAACTGHNPRHAVCKRFEGEHGSFHRIGLWF